MDLESDGDRGGEREAPRGEEGEVEVGDGGEAGGEVEEEVADVAAESEVCASETLEGAPLVGDE